MQLRRILAANTLYQLLGKGITSLTTLVITFAVARTYGANGYGDFIKAITFITVWYAVIDFGFNAVFLRITANKLEADSEFGNLFLLRIVWSLIISLVAVGIIALLPFDSAKETGFSPEVKLAIVILIPTLIFYSVHISYNALFQKWLRYDKSVIVASISAVVSALIILLAVYQLAPIYLVVSGYVVGGIVLAGLSFVLARSGVTLKESILQASFSKIKTLFIYAFPLGLTLLVSLVNFRADIFILSYFKPSSDVGIYGFAAKIFEFQLVLPVFFMNALYPILLSSFYIVEKRLILLKKSFIALMGFSVMFTIIGFTVALMLVLNQNDFSLSAIPLSILSCFLPIFYTTALLMWVLIAAGKRWELFRIYACGALSNIILNMLLIPSYGYTAAAVVTGVSETIVLLLLLYNARKYIFINNTRQI
jgi:O-antigen/teichoic acid export membrane protein